MLTTTRSRLAAGVLALAMALAGCSSSGSGTDRAAGSSASSSGSSAAQSWPRTITHDKGTTQIKEQPKNIVSTSITLTGSLLAIGAPVTYSAATEVSSITDKQGFFSQWGEVAGERGVKVLYKNLKFDEEAVIAAKPDLIVVSSLGADSTADQYATLSRIAPTVVIDYSKPWQTVVKQLGRATGNEAGATKAIADFDARAKTARSKITPPGGGTANVVVWNGVAGPTAFAKAGSAHAEIIEALGFTVEAADDSADTSKAEKRNDFAFLSTENAVKNLKADTVFVARADTAVAADLKATKVLASAPAVKAGRVIALGADSFRIDYYSGLNIIKNVEAALS